jgi:hypothetical protein
MSLVRPLEVSGKFAAYKLLFDVNAAVVGNVLSIDRHMARNYRLEGDGRDVIECCIMFSVDWPPNRDIVLEGEDLNRTATLYVKYYCPGGFRCAVKVSGFNTRSLVNNCREDKTKSVFTLGDIAKYIHDPLTITLEFGHIFDDASLRGDLGGLFESGEHSDVAVECGDRTFDCHKAILSARSETFAAMFRSNFLENAESKVTVKDMDPEVAEWLLSFIYTGVVAWTAVSVDLLKAADMYMVSELRKQCCKVLSWEITAHNCCQMLVAGNRYDDDLFERAIEVLVDKSQVITKTDEWRDMEEDGQLWKRISRELIEKFM